VWEPSTHPQYIFVPSIQPCNLVAVTKIHTSQPSLRSGNPEKRYQMRRSLKNVMYQAPIAQKRRWYQPCLRVVTAMPMSRLDRRILVFRSHHPGWQTRALLPWDGQGLRPRPLSRIVCPSRFLHQPPPPFPLHRPALVVYRHYHHLALHQIRGRPRSQWRVVYPHRRQPARNAQADRPRTQSCSTNLGQTTRTSSHGPFHSVFWRPPRVP